MSFKKDLNRFFEHMPSHLKGWKCWAYLYLSPGMEAILNYRFGKHLKTKGGWRKLCFYWIYMLMKLRVMKKYGIEIDANADIGSGFTIQHFSGIFIAGGVKMGKNCRVRQGVTIGASGSGKSFGCPTIGDNVMFHPGCKVFGKIKIGNNVTIGANAVVHKDLPDNCVVAASPGYKIIKENENGASPVLEKY